MLSPRAWRRFWIGLAALIAMPALVAALVLLVAARSDLPPPETCPLRADETLCLRGVADDGEIRFSLATSDRADCCIMERRSLSPDRIDFRVRVCTADGAALDCTAYERPIGYGESALIGGATVKRDPDWPGDIGHFRPD